jgi:SAM-dependent methyltransferase
MGIEPSTEGCSIAKSKNPNAMIIQADIIHDDRFDEILRTADAVVCTEVLEHLDNPEQLIFKVSQVINDNGLFIVSVPGGPRSAFDKYIGHRRHFSRTRLRKMLTTNGFSDVEVMAAGFPGFNIYKICVMLLGRRLIVDSQSIARSGSATFASNIFGKLMSRSLTNSIFGWQLFAIARR